MESQFFVMRMLQTQFQVYKQSQSYTHARRSAAYSTPTDLYTITGKSENREAKIRKQKMLLATLKEKEKEIMF